MKRRRHIEDDEEPESGGSSKWIIIAVALSLLVIGIGAGAFLLIFSGETHQDVFDRFKEKFAAKRQQLKAIAAKLPPPGAVKKNQGPANLNPRPIYDPKSKSFNTSVLMVEQLRDPDLQLRTPEQFDLNLFEGLLLMNLQWTGPRSPMADSVRGQKARTNLADELEATLSQSYLLVLRPVRYDPPRVFDNRFAGGDVDLEAFLVDWRTTNIVASVRVAGRADDIVRGIKGNMDAAVFSSMWKNVRGNLARSLSEVSGGTFVFD